MYMHEDRSHERLFHNLLRLIQCFRTNDIKQFVLDEADEMLSRGFKDQIYDVFRHLSSEIQVKMRPLHSRGVVRGRGRGGACPPLERRGGAANYKIVEKWPENASREVRTDILLPTPPPLGKRSDYAPAS